MEAVTPRSEPAVRHVTAAALPGLAPPTVSGGGVAATRGRFALAARRRADVTSSTWLGSISLFLVFGWQGPLKRLTLMINKTKGNSQHRDPETWIQQSRVTRRACAAVRLSAHGKKLHK